MIDAWNPVTRAVRPVVAEVRPSSRAVGASDQSVGHRAAVVDADSVLDARRSDLVRQWNRDRRRVRGESHGAAVDGDAVRR